MPMSEKVDPELVTTGPYRTVRHPIFLARVGAATVVPATKMLPGRTSTNEQFTYWLGAPVTSACAG